MIEESAKKNKKSTINEQKINILCQKKINFQRKPKTKVEQLNVELKFCFRDYSFCLNISKCPRNMERVPFHWEEEGKG